VSRVGRIEVGARFNGPYGSGNGGYTAGLLAAERGDDDHAGPVRVTLREPPPLETPLDVAPDDDGRLAATFGGAVIATAAPATFTAEHVAPVDVEAARHAQDRYPGLFLHPFPGCFVCGTDRPAGDGLALRPGRVGVGADRRVATTWTPDPSLAADDDGDGLVAAPFLWAALDCPGGWASDLTTRPMVLGSMTAAVHGRPRAGDPCVVVARVLAVDGRKTFSASTVYDVDGRALGHAESTWIALRTPVG